MSAVSNRVMPRSIALWMTLREVSRSVRWAKLLQPRPTAETRRPEPPRLRICMDDPVGMAREEADIVARAASSRNSGAVGRRAWQLCGTKRCGPGQTRRLTGAAWGRVIRDGGPDQTRVQPSRAMLRRRDIRTYPQAA